MTPKALVITGYGETSMAADAFVYRTLPYLAQTHHLTLLTPVRSATVFAHARRAYSGRLSVVSNRRLFTTPSWQLFRHWLPGYAEGFDRVILIGCKGSHLPPDRLAAQIAADDTWKHAWSPAQIDHRKLYAFHLLAQRLPADHYIIDPLQDVRCTAPLAAKWFFYDTVYDGVPLHYRPFVEAGCPAQLPVAPLYDFVFGCTADFDPTGRRQSLIRHLLALEQTGRLGTARLFFQCKALGLASTVDHAQYLDYLAHARRTLIIPSNDPAHFSAFRFWEAYRAGCTVAVDPAVRLEHLYAHHPELREDPRILSATSLGLDASVG